MSVHGCLPRGGHCCAITSSSSSRLALVHTHTHHHLRHAAGTQCARPGSAQHARTHAAAHAAAAHVSVAAAAASLALGFLPWNGCDAGGFYATGQAGTPGKDCQEVYQPAEAAEQRLRAKLAPLPAPTPVAVAVALAAQPTVLPSSRGEQPPAPPPQTAEPASPSSSAALAPTPEQHPLNTAALLSDEAKRFLRDELLAEKRAREQKLTEDAWQTLE
ncbi:hypothetical protein FOA52_001166 [Chlamydomonas sp. UWO 241]|nr:hypothetical protein FOA52_001166 [Chlamydomonas sp. UWO 241]